MRFTAKQYALMFGSIAENAQNKDALTRDVSALLTFADMNNDMRVMQKAYDRFAALFRVRHSIAMVDLEFATPHDKKNFLPRIRTMLTRTKQDIEMHDRINASLISGIRLVYDQNILVDASMGGAVGRIFVK
jgi:F0F1-type ATP synthase delta subunit